MTDEEEIKDSNRMEQELNRLRRDSVEDLANTAQLLGSWMAEQKLTVAEQLTVTELLRSSILVGYMHKAQKNEMIEFMKDHPGAKVVVVDASKTSPPVQPDKFAVGKN